MIHDRRQQHKFLFSVLGVISFAIGAMILMLMLNSMTANLGQLSRMVQDEVGWNFAGLLLVANGFLLLNGAVRFGRR